jgi:CNT family concentrative nucleoside transporter
VRVELARDENFFAAIIQGANAGVRLIVGIVALLIAVIGLVSLADKIIGLLGGWAAGLFHVSAKLTFKEILGWIFFPLTVILGMPIADAQVLAPIIGERLIATEVASYRDLALAVKAGQIQDIRSAVIATYALCGFAHFASLAIFIGGISAVASERMPILVKIGWRALVAATLACLMTACVAGLFFVDGAPLFRGLL